MMEWYWGPKPGCTLRWKRLEDPLGAGGRGIFLPQQRHWEHTGQETSAARCVVPGVTWQQSMHTHGQHTHLKAAKTCLLLGQCTNHAPSTAGNRGLVASLPPALDAMWRLCMYQPSTPSGWGHEWMWGPLTENWAGRGARNHSQVPNFSENPMGMQLPSGSHENIWDEDAHARLKPRLVVTQCSSFFFSSIYLPSHLPQVWFCFFSAHFPTGSRKRKIENEHQAVNLGTFSWIPSHLRLINYRPSLTDLA